MGAIVLGSTDPVETSVKVESSDRDATVVEVEGLYSLLKIANARSYCPSDFTVESSSLVSNGDGTGKLTIRCVKYEGGLSFSATKTTFRVDMLEVQYDLEDHPHLVSERDVIVKWLATDQNERIVTKNGNTKYYFQDTTDKVEITQADYPFTLKFINAYRSGIKSFYRYYPVIEKISIYKNPPGMSRSERSFTGGSPDFSPGIGHFDTPPLNLNGYPSTHWFKSKDSWVQNADTTWTRTEQWTYTPESSSGNNAWIYNSL